MIDIVPGDVVVCVDAGLFDGDVPVCVTPGAMYRVQRVFTVPTWGSAVFLRLAGVDANTESRGFYAWRFRKVKKADTDFTEYMRKMRPAEKRVDA